MVMSSERLTSANELHAAITNAVRRKRAADYDLALLLRRCLEHGLYRDLGYVNLADYGEQAHGLGRAKTRALVRLAGVMQAVPAVRDAVRDGIIPWTKARELARVVTQDTAEEWLSHAVMATNRELEHLARHAFAGDSVGRAAERCRQADPLRQFIVRNLSTDQHRILEDAIERVRQDAGIAPEDFQRGDALVTIVQRFLAELDDNPAATPPTAVRFQRVVHVCAECRQAEGETGRPDDTDVLMSDCDTEDIDGMPHRTRVRTGGDGGSDNGQHPCGDDVDGARAHRFGDGCDSTSVHPGDETADGTRERPSDETADGTRVHPGDETADGTRVRPSDETADGTLVHPGDETADGTRVRPSDETSNGSHVVGSGDVEDGTRVRVEAGSDPDKRGTRRRAIPPRVRTAVLHRDRHQCRVPDCSNRLWLDLHHIIPRSQGGPHTQDNLICLCSSHHRLLHDGRLGIQHAGWGSVRVRFASGREEVVVLEPVVTLEPGLVGEPST